MKILVAYSGGKDSQASLIWAAKEFGAKSIEAVFSDTGWEHPVTYEHIQMTCMQLGVKITTVKSIKYNGMIDLATKKKRFPSTMARFCTSELKAIPFINYVLDECKDVLVIQGIRAKESDSRSLMKAQCTYFKYYTEPYQSNSMKIAKYEAMPKLSKGQKTALTKAKKRLSEGKEDYKYFTHRRKEVLEFVSKYVQDILRPVFDWPAQEVIDYIIANGQKPNQLYFEGFKRVGCFPCFMAGHHEVKEILKRYPEKFEEIIQLEEQIGSSFFKIDYVPKRFQTGVCNRTGKSFTKAVDIKKYLINKSATIDMFEDEAISCSSFYHLCE